MRYSALAGGKRLRPFFTLEAGRMFDADEGQPAARRHAPSNACTPTRSSTTICRAWTMTICAAAAHLAPRVR
jgi:geranylgeranyl pyrophosphate synthase